MIHAHGLTTDDLELVSTGYNPVVVAEGAIDVYPVFLSNEPDTLTRVIGVPIRVFEAADYGVPTLGVVYLVTEEFLEQEGNRDRVERFLRATLRAFQFALDDPAAAIESTRKFIPEEADLEHERFILDTELANAVSPLTDQNGLGWFTGRTVRRAAGCPARIRRDAERDRPRHRPRPLVPRTNPLRVGR